MSWENDRAIKRIFNTFKRLNKNVFQQDIDALKQLKESLDFHKIQQVNDNKIYAKVLCMLIKERYIRMPDINIVLSTIQSDIRNSSLPEHIELLTIKIRATQLSMFFQECKIDVPNNELNDIEALAKREQEWHDKFDKPLFEEIIKLWQTDVVTDKFYNTANTILQNVDNYK